MQLIDIVKQVPIIVAQAAAVVAALGGVGTALEEAGEALGWTWLVAVGQRMEAIFMDIPKMIRGSRYTPEIAAIVASEAPELLPSDLLSVKPSPKPNKSEPPPPPVRG